MECLQQGSLNKTVPFGDDTEFSIDELLDFSNGFSEMEEQSPELQEPEEKSPETEKICSVSVNNSALSSKDNFVPFTETELTVPEVGLESLEWLSHFVEDSFSDYSLTGKLPPENRSEPVVPVQQPHCFTTPVQTKARTKRARAGVRVWPVLSSSFTESSISSSSSTSTTTSFSPVNNLAQNVESLIKKSQKRKIADSGGAAQPQPRRCSHCGVTKTPQWRAGPLGSKTLCNACGVRFKSGRLLPEYRPACSPTFSSEMHSNNHRKVLEMRRQKEAEIGSTGLPPPVQSF